MSRRYLADKRIIFGARKPTEEAAPLTGIPLIIEAPFPHERTLHWRPVEQWKEEDVLQKVQPRTMCPVEGDANAALPLVSGEGNTAVMVSQEVLDQSK